MQSTTLTLLCAGAVIGVVFLCLFLLKGIIVATKEELAKRINDAADRADKAKTEIVDAVEALKLQINEQDASSPEIEAALTRLDGAVGGLDDLNPDTTLTDGTDTLSA